jgi:HD-GYP domain-containing protein (c-di-GMP phosphodiesterase class II)
MTAEAHRWRRRPTLSGLLRVFIVLAPVAFGVSVGLLVATALPHPPDFWARMAWSAAVMTASTLALVVAGRLVRRLLPLALLLRVGLVLPDEAPRRFGVAMRAIRPNRGANGDDLAGALALLTSLLTHDRRTRGHSERVAAYSVLIAEEMGLGEKGRAEARWAGLLHDVGKIDVPTSILNKPSKLDDDEWVVMSAHPDAGRARVEPLRPWLGDAVDAVGGHHERWNGTGYPRGIPSAELPLSTRIASLADAFETMTAARSYKDPLSIGEARTEATECAGQQFDPAVVRALLNVSVPRLWMVAGPLAWIAQVPVLGWMLQGTLAPGAALAQGAVVAGQVAGSAAIVGTALVTSGATASIDEPAAPPVVLTAEEAPASTTGSVALDFVAGDARSDLPERAPTRSQSSGRRGANPDAPRRGGAGGPAPQAVIPDLRPAGTVGPPAHAGPVAPPPGHGGEIPGNGGVPPGLGTPPPGHTAAPPVVPPRGPSVVPPGHNDLPPGRPETPPGHQRSVAARGA